MDSKYVLSIAETAWYQIKCGVGMNVVFSWGVSKRFYTTYKDMPTLMLRVSGAIHKGWVYVSLDELTDTYTITLQNTKHVVKKTVEGIYCDQLGHVIDTLVERPEGMSNEEYSHIAMADSARKMSR